MNLDTYTPAALTALLKEKKDAKEKVDKQIEEKEKELALLENPSSASLASPSEKKEDKKEKTDDRKIDPTAMFATEREKEAFEKEKADLIARIEKSLNT